MANSFFLVIVTIGVSLCILSCASMERSFASKGEAKVSTSEQNTCNEVNIQDTATRALDGRATLDKIVETYNRPPKRYEIFIEAPEFDFKILAGEKTSNTVKLSNNLSCRYAVLKDPVKSSLVYSEGEIDHNGHYAAADMSMDTRISTRRKLDLILNYNSGTRTRLLFSAGKINNLDVILDCEMLLLKDRYGKKLYFSNKYLEANERMATFGDVLDIFSQSNVFSFCQKSVPVNEVELKDGNTVVIL